MPVGAVGAVGVVLVRSASIAVAGRVLCPAHHETPNTTPTAYTPLLCIRVCVWCGVVARGCVRCGSVCVCVRFSVKLGVHHCWDMVAASAGSVPLFMFAMPLMVKPPSATILIPAGRVPGDGIVRGVIQHEGHNTISKSVNPCRPCTRGWYW